MPRKFGKRLKADREGFDFETPVALTDAVEKIKGFKKTKFDQSIDICLHLGIDDKQADQKIRGAMSLPHGIGKTRRVIAVVSTEKAKEAKEAGAVEAGAEDLVKKIEDGWMEFDVVVAEPPMMRVLAKVARTLGPKGLMPSPKNGTVTPKITEAIKEFAAGKVEFRNDSGGNVHATIGKQSFDSQQLTENAQTFIDAIVKMKPATTKGQYVQSVTLSGTMTPGVRVEI